MGLYRRAINLIPQATEKEVREEEMRSTAGIYAALLPMFAALIWLILVYVNSIHQAQINNLEQEIVNRNNTIASYNSVRREHAELVKKTDALKDLVTKDFEPNQFFLDLEQTIGSTKDAQSGIFSYERDTSGVFTINAKAGSYLDLAKLIVVFEDNPVFGNAVVDQISLDEAEDTVNFQLTFEYKDILGTDDEFESL